MAKYKLLNNWFTFILLRLNGV